MAGHVLLSGRDYAKGEVLMLKIDLETIGDLAIIECSGQIVQRSAAFKLRQAVMSQSASRTIVLELTEVRVIGGLGLDMLLYLQKWAHVHNVRLKLFNPSGYLLERLNATSPLPEFEIATLDEMMALLGRYDSRYSPSAA